MGVGGSSRGEGGARRSRPRGARANGRASRDVPVPHGAKTLRFTIPSERQQGCEVQRQIIAAAQASGFEGENLFALRIALEEAMVNAIKHGNRLDPAKQVRVEATISPEKVEILVEDEGPGFDRAAVPDPTADENLTKASGRGILLIESYMTEVAWDRGGRRLHMAREKR
jgi:serine/threonine-protein kinase RsbW